MLAAAVVLADEFGCDLNSRRLVKVTGGKIMVDTAPATNSFRVKNCALASIATAERASSLVELRDKLMVVDEGCLYHHFWGGRLHPKFVHPHHHNDFAQWAYQALHDNVLAERLNIIDPTDFNNLEELRQELVETLDQRLDETDLMLWAKRENQFHFVTSKTVVFESSMTITEPKELGKAISILPPGSIFYHLVDARSRTQERIDDFSLWLKTFDDQYAVLLNKMHSIDPYFLSLSELRDEMAKTIESFFQSSQEKV